jgi:hypothetical protein
VNLNHLAGQDERAVRDALIAGVGSLRARNVGKTSFKYLDVVHEVAKVLLKPPASNGAANEWNSYQNGYREQPQGDDEYPDNRRLHSAIWGLIAEGVLFPRLKSMTPDGHPHLIERLVLTARGERVVMGGDEHPLHPGFIARFRARAPNIRISDEVVSRMEDALSCMEKSLLRAAIVMVGLALEETLRLTHAAMVNLAVISKAATPLTTAKQLLDDIEKAVQSWTTSNDEQHKLKKAISAAESIRTDRNTASHPGVVLSDAAAVEELVVLAGRQVPILWEIPIRQAVTQNGFVVP